MPWRSAGAWPGKHCKKWPKGCREARCPRESYAPLSTKSLKTGASSFKSIKSTTYK